MVAGQLFFDGLSMGMIYMLLVTGLVLISSINKILFIAYGVFYTIGAYATWYLVTQFELPYFVGLVVAALATGLLGALCGVVIFRRLSHVKGAFIATLVASSGLLMLLGQGTLLMVGTKPRRIPPVFKSELMFGGIHISTSKVVLMVVGVGVALALMFVYRRTSFGRSMRALAYAPDAARLYGIDADRVYIVVLALATVLAGLSGGLLAPIYGMNTEMGTTIIWAVMLVMMLGGMDSLIGGIVGGLVVGQLLSFGQYYIGSLSQIVIFVVIGIVLYFKPHGLLGSGIDIGV
jgi:branched-chain amino acid transport system permease protein